MTRARCLIVLTFVLLTGACYRATVDLAVAPSTVTIKRSWAACWLFGLVPPKTVKTASECSHGVAKVETKLGFWNQVVGSLTLGIYTPMHIKVTCAEARSALAPVPQPDLVVPEGATEEDVVRVFEVAAEQAVDLGRPMFVGF